jgi:hypothetical protein
MQSNRSNRSVIFGLLLSNTLVATGCKEKNVIPSGAMASASATSGSGATPVTSNSANPPNLAEMSFAQLKLAAAKCRLDSGQVDSTCAGTWREHSALEDGKHDSELVEMLGDPSPAMRWLATQGLDHPVFSIAGKTSVTRPYCRETVLAKKALSFAGKERNVAVAASLGSAGALISLSSTGLKAEIQALLATHPLPEMRGTLAKGLLHHNPELYDRVLQVAKGDKSPEVRVAAVHGLAAGNMGKIDPEKLCGDWLGMLSDRSTGVVGTAAWRLSYKSDGELCAKHWDQMCARVEARARSGVLGEAVEQGSPYFAREPATALEALLAQPGVTTKQKSCATRTLARLRKK